jgi:hypothetical protein
MDLTRLDLFLWAGGLLGHLTLLSVLSVRGRIRTFPFFTALIATNVARTVTLYFVRTYGTATSYCLTYWWLLLLDTVMQLCVVYEVASRVFRPLNIWAPDLRARFGWMVGVSIFAALVLAWLEQPPAVGWMHIFVARGNLFVAALMSELFVTMTALSISARFPWRNHAAAIARGLGGYSLITVLTETARSTFTLGGNAASSILFSHMRMFAYLACVIYWIIAFWCEDRRAQGLTREMYQEIFSLQRQLSCGLAQLRARTKE